MDKHRYYYYYDERNDDFANNGIDGKPTPPDFDYLPKNLAWRIFKPLVYYFILMFPFIWAFSTAYILRVKNTKVLRDRKDRKKGYFVYGNHTTWVEDAVVHPMMSFPKPAYTIVHPDAISIKYAGTIVKMMGAMPNPSSRQTYVGFMNAAKEMYENGNPIVVYPEAHIWPKYNGVRDFPDVSFNLPVKLDAPCFVRSTVYRKRKNGHTRAEVFYDGPFYADQSLPAKEAQKDLRDRIHAKMCERCADSVLDSRYHYIKVDSPAEVRTETKEL